MSAATRPRLCPHGLCDESGRTRATTARCYRCQESPPFPIPVSVDIRIGWSVYEYATRFEAEAFVAWADHNGIETRGIAAAAIDGRYLVWSRG